jgi:thioredoxin reductase (NADPH)
VRNVIIIGSGPAGYTAAIYAARANLKPVLIASSVEAGGELMNTTEVENFPGFPQGIQGPDLMFKMQEQAERFGTEVILDDVTEVSLDGPVKTVTTGSSGTSWCATCDGFFFKEKTIAVVGGGDSAMEEATFLTRFASKVYVIHRKDSLRASKIMQERAFQNEKIEFLWNNEVVGINGENAVESVTLRNTVDGSEQVLPLGGRFVAIGNDPRVHLVHQQLELTSDGVIAVDGRSSRTSLAGVFAAGDVIDPHYRQAITAAASGTVAALDMESYLAELEQAEAHLDAPADHEAEAEAEAVDSASARAAASASEAATVGG